MVFTAPGFRFSFLAFSFSFAAGRFRHRRRGAQSLGGCHPWLHRWGRNIPLRHRRKRRRHLPLQGRPWCPVFRRRADHWSAALRDWGPGKQTDEQCSSLRLFRPRRRGGLWPPPFSLFRSGDHRSPLRLVRRPVSTVWPTIVPPVVLPPAGEAPAKRVMRENDRSQSAVKIGEVGSVLPHLSAALTSSPLGEEQTPPSPPQAAATPPLSGAANVSRRRGSSTYSEGGQKAALRLQTKSFSVVANQ